MDAMGPYRPDRNTQQKVLTPNTHNRHKSGFEGCDARATTPHVWWGRVRRRVKGTERHVGTSLVVCSEAA